jgi:hypothetical protein
VERDLKIPELAIAVAAENHNPTVLNPDFLKYNEIVPKDWTLVGDPITTPVVSQVAYDEQVAIAAQADKVVFSRSNGDIRDPDGPDVAELAARYVTTLPHVDYTGLGINIQGHVVIPEGMQAAKAQIISRYTAAGPWADFADGLDEATVSFSYRRGRSTLRVSISPALYTDDSGKDGEETSEGVPVIHYGGSSQTEIVGNLREDRLKDLLSVLGNWREQLDVYTDLVENSLLP